MRLCSWNIHLGIQRQRILTTVRHSEHFRDLDLLLLQEASVEGHQTDAQRIATAFGSGWQALQRNVDQLQGRVRGLGVVWNSSAFQLQAAELLPLPHLHGSALRRRHRYWLHPLRLRPRSVLVADGLASGMRLRLYIIHLSPIGFTFQMEQLATVLRDAAHRPAADVTVLAGDFNSLRMDRRRWAAWFAAREDEGFVNASQDIDWTFRSLRQKLDNALVRCPAGATCQAHAPDVPGSDHLPVFVTVQVQAR